MSNAKRLTTNAKIDIDHVAKLANLNLDEKEKKLLSTELAQILDYVGQIESVETKNTQPTFNVSSNKNTQRPDIVAKSLTQEEALSNAKSTKNGSFVTKGVFENE